MKMIHKQLKQIKLPNIDYYRIVTQSQQLIRIKKDSDNSLKLSEGIKMAI